MFVNSCFNIIHLRLVVLKNLYKGNHFPWNHKTSLLIKFYSKEVDGVVGLYAYDETNGSFDYLLGYYATG